MKHDPLIVALDVDSLEEGRRLVKLLRKDVACFKIGSYLFTAAGPDVVTMVQDGGAKIFLDLKYHDIPHTVARACEAALSLGVFMLNVHASGGKEMMKAAAGALQRAKDPAILLGVTVLTSDAGKKGTTAEVVKLANLARYCGLTGVVCSAFEARAVRKKCGDEFVIVTPGIRLPISGSFKAQRAVEGEARSGSAGRGGDASPYDDQKRVAGPGEAIRSGANYIVVGRPVLNAADPVRVVAAIREDLET